tara:strand:- start:1254 stop:3248 length:1995 start_codon:yes stop_codon:yes gene_type:complete
MKGIMNLTEDKVKLVGYTFAISLLIPPNVGLNIIGLNFEDLPLIFLFSYLLILKINDFRKNNFDKFDLYFFLFLSVFIIYTNLFVENKGIFNQTNFRFYFYFFLSYLVINIYDSNKNKIVNIFEPLHIVMVINFLIILTKFEINGNLNGWISNNTAGNNPFTSGRLGGVQGGGPNVIGIICAISVLICIYKILISNDYFNYLKNNLLNSLILFISLFNLYLTYSRGSYLALGIGFAILLLTTDSLKTKIKLYLFTVLTVLTLIFVYLNPSIFLKQTNRGFLTELGVNYVNLFKGTGGGNYVKTVYKEYLISLDNKTLKEKFNITYSNADKNSNKNLENTREGMKTDGYLKLEFDYRDGYLPRSVVSFYFSNEGINWEQIGFDHTNGELINLIENDSYFEVGGWGDGQSNDDSFLDANIKKVIIKTNSEISTYEFPKFRRGLDYYILTPRLRNVYRGDIEYTDSGIFLERPRNYWLALPNYINLSQKDFEVIINLEIDEIPKGNETIFSQSSILRLNDDFNDQSWKWAVVEGRMYFFWIENVDNGYVNYLGGKSLRSGNLISNNGKFATSNIPEFDISQYDEITTSHNGFLTMAVEYGILPVSLIVLFCLYLILKNFQKTYTLELTIFLMFLLQNLTNDLIYSPDVSIYFWIIPMFLLKNILKSR